MRKGQRDAPDREASFTHTRCVYERSICSSFLKKRIQQLLLAAVIHLAVVIVATTMTWN
jgi:hypothetical protein